MLYWLFYEQLFQYFSPFRVVQYLTFRTACATITALLMSIVLGPWTIKKLREFSFGQHIREDGPKSHQKKAGTPTMGGMLILASSLAPTLLWANLRDAYVWIAMLAIVGFGFIGFWDDYTKIAKKRNLGLTSKQKFMAQILVAMVIGLILLAMHANGFYDTKLNVPFFKSYKPDLLLSSLMQNPWTYFFGFLPFFLFMIIVIVGASNAVNLTDGLDGLAIGLMIISSGAMTVLCYVNSHKEFATYLDIARVPNAGELTILCGAMMGASLGFLCFNAHPAEMFMGDVGALALGGGLGTIAVLIKQEFLLIFIGGVYVIELLSVVLQVGSFKLRGKRIFKMAPLHHHFEALGWSETKVVIRFWVAGLIMALFALTTLKLR